MELWLGTLAVLATYFAFTEAAPVGICLPGRAVYTHDDANCRLYYKCSGRAWLSEQCPLGLLYNPTLFRCVPQSSYTCPYSASSGAGSGGCTSTSCQNGGVCLMTGTGVRQCSCVTGWTGASCEVKATPVSPKVVPGTSTSCKTVACKNGGQCIDDQCFCPLGYTGHHCTVAATSSADVCPVPKEMKCDPPCENGGKCLDEGGKPTCFCADGFGGDTCSIILEPCSITTCENGGVCEEKDGRAKCKCEDGFSGDHCQMRVSSACAHLECQNNAPCKKEGRTISCDCLKGFTGDKCQYVDFCPQIVCLNKGECQTGGDGNAFCSCPVGYTGAFCEIELSCEGFTCYNGGECKIKDNKRVCECPDRSHGERCETKLTCDGVAPCHDGSTCVNSEDGFVCACPLGRTGQYCKQLRPCSDNVVCENGGTCEDDVDNGATCECKKGFQGPRCEVASDDCGGCQNGGVCHLPRVFGSKSTDKHCACPAGFSGKHCEVKSECTIPCPEDAGRSGKIYHIFVYPDIVNKEYVYLCAEGRLTHLHYCEEGLWFDPFALSCHTKTSFADAKEVAGRALYPSAIP